MIKKRILWGRFMFGKKKLYKIVWHSLCDYTTIIAAKNEAQALKKFYNEYGRLIPSIISFEEYKCSK